MRRFRDWLLLTLASLSLVTCVGVVSLWIRSYWIGDTYSFIAMRGTYDRAAELYFYRGRVGLAFVHCVDLHPEWDTPAFNPPSTGFRHMSSTSRDYMPHGRDDWGAWDFVYDPGDDAPGLRFQDFIRILEIPAWSLALALVFAPSWIVHRRLSRRRFPSGCCPKCGYDLRATPNRCPECGFRRSGPPDSPALPA